VQPWFMLYPNELDEKYDIPKPRNGDVTVTIVPNSETLWGSDESLHDNSCQLNKYVRLKVQQFNADDPSSQLNNYSSPEGRP
jgi:hypothetical protein